MKKFFVFSLLVVILGAFGHIASAAAGDAIYICGATFLNDAPVFEEPDEDSLQLGEITEGFSWSVQEIVTDEEGTITWVRIGDVWIEAANLELTVVDDGSCPDLTEPVTPQDGLSTYHLCYFDAPRNEITFPGDRNSAINVGDETRYIGLSEISIVPPTTAWYGHPVEESAYGMCWFYLSLPSDDGTISVNFVWLIQDIGAEMNGVFRPNQHGTMYLTDWEYLPIWR